MKYFIFQGNDHDCGFAALKMYLATLTNDKSYLYIPKPEKGGRYSLDDLVEIAKEYDACLETYGCSKDYFECLDVPCLTLIDENHVVMVKKKYKHSIVLYNPGNGKIKMRKDEFLRRWRNVILTIDNPETIKKIDKIRQHLLPLKWEFICNFVALFSSIALITTFYLLNKNDSFYFSFIFLLVFVIGQIIERIVLYKQVYTFDLNYIPKYFANKKNCSKEKYISYVNYKKEFFTHKRGLISSLLIAFVITFLLCFNDFRNVFVLFALILLKLLEILIFSRNEQDTKNEIAELENRNFKTTNSTIDLALEANVKADGHIFYNSAKEVFYIFISFLFAIVMMFVTNNFGCNYVIFHFVMYYAGFVSYNQLLLSLSNRKETMKLEQRFYDSCNL